MSFRFTLLRKLRYHASAKTHEKLINTSRKPSEDQVDLIDKSADSFWVVRMGNEDTQGIFQREEWDIQRTLFSSGDSVPKTGAEDNMSLPSFHDSALGMDVEGASNEIWGPQPRTPACKFPKCGKEYRSSADLRYVFHLLSLRFASIS